ncbi:DUF1707 and DUF4870 domain-containing protein [Actinomadura sp. WMMB 499]|uniref:DUF1707 and DUF4870 domain-containing protein n=1 Tax=Actinomadura sp. WMMB 499 TaxID=1219491 RepID=UPI0012463E2F|nr:DUF1707 and DUF4870 domain-containing protein [Actinomadura sp. WMMB 499]QFG21041.1 DUF1707 and DUF4870 domain-containing protein [Actinomadura sp. WMMB 499]
MSTQGHLRVSDAEREPVLGRLKDAFAEGRIDQDEFDMRAHLVLTAKTRDDLAVVTGDLAPAPAAAGPEPDGGDRVMAATAHALGAWTLFVGPLVVMLTRGRSSEFVRRQAVEAVNLQVTLLLITIVTFGVGGMLYAVTWIASIVAAIYALAGQPFRYPWILRLMK